jgi:hypothetical protein
MLTVPGSTLQSAAQHVGLTVYKLRWLMGQPHVLRWLLTEKQARLEAASAGNVGALLAVRDRPEGNEMAKVHAAKTLETMLDVTSERTGIGRSAHEVRKPGLQIVILPPRSEQEVVGPTQAALIEATPVPEADPVRPENDCGPKLPISFPIRISGKADTSGN